MNTSETSYRTYARIAGFTFLFYIASGISTMAISNESQIGEALLLSQNFSALILGVTLFMLTYKQGLGLAIFALTCRVVESVHSEAAIFFVVASLIFSWLLLRGRMIPSALAQLGIIASALLVVILPLQLTGLFGGNAGWSSSITWLMWLPMLFFEIILAFWLMIKGVVVPATE